MHEETGRVVERVARESYGRLVAYLAADSGNVAEAEDLLSDSLLKAIKTWPKTGVPDKPEAWLLRVGRRQRIDAIRRRQVHERKENEIIEWFEMENSIARNEDRRFALMCACAAPGLDRSLHTPLILNVILGIPAKDIASAFLVRPATMSQRLSRAKAQIKELGVRLEIPESEEYAERIESVAEAIYGAYGIGWELIPGSVPGRSSLAAEALWLSEFLAQSLPNEPEALGLHATLLYLDSRNEARRSDGHFVPIDDQQIEMWDLQAIECADDLLRKAGEHGRIGKFQLEACIQAAHAERAKTGKVNWPAIVSFYRALYNMAPSVGCAVALSGALYHAGKIAEAIALLKQLEENDVASYQPFWVLRTWLERSTGDMAAAEASGERAIGLTEDPAVRDWLLSQWSN